jgi:uncharacterized membrane protein YhhN
MLPWVLLSVAALAVLLLAESRGAQSLRWVAKPLASTGFLGVAVTAGALDTAYGRVLLVALVFCWLGDVLLIPKDRRAFLAGLVAFLLGHVVLIGAFAMRGFAPSGALFAALGVLPAAVIALRWLAPHVSKSMQMPVRAYVAAISLMVLAAAAATAAGAGPHILVGAICFFVSDLAVAREQFVVHGFVNKTWGLPLYYGATLLLATTAAEV